MGLAQELYVGNTGCNWYLRVYQDSVSQSIDGNYSNITLRATLRGDKAGHSVRFDRRSAYIGSTSFDIAYIHNSAEHDLGSTTIKINHNADGTGSYSVGFGISTSYALNGSSTVSASLPTIPRASSFSISGSTLGSAMSIAISRASSSFTHTVDYQFGSIKRSYTGQTTSCAFTPPLSDASQIPNSESGTGTIVVTTFNGSTKVGSTSKTFTLNLPSSAVPSFSALNIARVDNGVPTAWGLYVQGKSKATLSISGASGIYGSTIKGYSISGGGYSSTASSFTTGVLGTSGVVKFTATITDSRGRTATKEISITVQANNIPSLILKAERCTSNGTVSNTGTYVKISPVYSIASIGGKNSVASRSFKIGTYTNTACASGSSVVLGAGAISVAISHIVTGVVTDALGQSSGNITVTVSSSKVPFNLRNDERGAGFGKYGEILDTIDSAWAIKAPSATFSGKVTAGSANINGATTIAGTTNISGTTKVNNTFTATTGNFTNLNKGGVAVPNINETPELVTVTGWDEAWKFPSGLMIIRYWALVSVTFKSWGTMFSCDISARAIPASVFTVRPSFFLGSSGYPTEGGNAWYAISSNGSVSQFPPIVIVRPTGYNGSYSYSMMAIGRWK